MQKKWLWLLFAVLLTAVLVIAGVLYPRLSAENDPGVLPAATSASTDRADGSEQEIGTAPESADPAQADAEPAADFTVLDADGNEDTLSAHIGKPVVVNFWATWCGFCVEELPAFDAAAERYADKIDLMMVDLTDGYRETAEDAKQFVRESGYSFPVYFDTQQTAADAYGVSGIPFTLFVNADGTVYMSYLGAMPEERLEQYLAALAGE